MKFNKLEISNNKKRKKAQMEMIGIAIVVVLLVIGMAFVFKALTKPPKRVHEKFSKEQTAQSILISIGRADADCDGLTFTELMQDCAEHVTEIDNLYSGDSYTGCLSVGCHDCGGGTPGSVRDSCWKVNKSLNDIFVQTLEVQKLPYRFRLYKSSPDDYIMKIVNRGCDFQNINVMRKFDVEKPGELTLPLSAGGSTVNARLDICTTAGR